MGESSSGYPDRGGLIRTQDKQAYAKRVWQQTCRRYQLRQKSLPRHLSRIAKQVAREARREYRVHGRVGRVDIRLPRRFIPLIGDKESLALIEQAIRRRYRDRDIDSCRLVLAEKYYLYLSVWFKDIP